MDLAVAYEGADSVVPRKSGEMPDNERFGAAFAQLVCEVAMGLLLGRKMLVQASYCTDSTTVHAVTGAIIRSRNIALAGPPGPATVNWWDSCMKSGHRVPPADTPLRPLVFGSPSAEVSFVGLLSERWNDSLRREFDSSAWGNDSAVLEELLAASVEVETSRDRFANTLAEVMPTLPTMASARDLLAIADEFDTAQQTRLTRQPNYEPNMGLGKALIDLARHDGSGTYARPRDRDLLRNAAQSCLNYIERFEGEPVPTSLRRSYFHAKHHVENLLSDGLTVDALEGLREYVDTCYNHIVARSLGVERHVLSQPAYARSARVVETGEVLAYRWLDDDFGSHAGLNHEDRSRPARMLAAPAPVDEIFRTVWEIILTDEWHSSYSEMHIAEQLFQSAQASDEATVSRHYDEYLGAAERHGQFLAARLADADNGVLWCDGTSARVLLKLNKGLASAATKTSGIAAAAFCASQVTHIDLGIGDLPDFVTTAAATSGFVAGYVSRRSRKLHTLGFEVASRALVIATT